ncbi:unnamed protein product [Absidia cylindrospora]
MVGGGLARTGAQLDMQQRHANHHPSLPRAATRIINSNHSSGNKKDDRTVKEQRALVHGDEQGSADEDHVWAKFLNDNKWAHGESRHCLWSTFVKTLDDTSSLNPMDTFVDLDSVETTDTRY